MPRGSTPSQRRPQYQHYIPRFLLKYFAIENSKKGPFKGPDRNGAFMIVTPANNKKGKIISKKFQQPVELLNLYRFEDAQLTLGADAEDGTFLSRNGIGRNFGLHDLYADEDATDANRVEKKLSKLESEAAIIIRNIVNAGDDGAKDEVTLTRREVNALRKFLFLQSYRTQQRWSQFVDLRFDEHTHRSVQAHIAQHLSHKLNATPKDVWLQVIEETLDTRAWEIKDNAKIFVHDRVEYWHTIKGKRLVIYRTTGSDEFLLAANGQGFVDARLLTVTNLKRHMDILKSSTMKQGDVYSGFDSSEFDGKIPVGGITGFHDWIRLHPVSPTVLLALVDNNLAAAQNGYPEYLKQYDELSPGPPSRFRHFPFPAAKVTYHNLSTKAAAAKSVKDFWTTPNTLDNVSLIDEKVLESRVEDRLTFSITSLNTSEAMLVNSLYLENARDSLGFRSPVSLYRSILWFEADDRNFWKHERDYGALKRQLRATFTCWPGQLMSTAQSRNAPTVNACRELLRLDKQPYTEEQLSAQKSETGKFLGQRFRFFLHPFTKLMTPKLDRSMIDQTFDFLQRTHDDVAMRNQEALGRVATRF